MPVITKKSRPNPSKVIWVADTMVKTAVTPSAQRDIKLGDATGHVKQGIVITGTMYFKDRNGKVIGWISEDGNTSLILQSFFCISPARIRGVKPSI